MSEETPNTSNIEALSPDVNERIRKAPMPTKGTLRRRQNVFVQFFKFARFNLRILGLVTREKLHNKNIR